MLEYEVFSQRLSAKISVATAKCAEMTLDTGIEERQDAFNPAELMLAALSAGMLKGIESVAPTLNFGFRDAACDAEPGVDVQHGRTPELAGRFGFGIVLFSPLLPT